MAAQFVATLISLGIILLPSLGAFAFSSFFSNNNSGKKIQVVEEDPENLIQTIEHIQATLHSAEQREIKDRSFKVWLNEFKNVARKAKDLLCEYQHWETCVRTKRKDMRVSALRVVRSKDSVIKKIVSHV